MNKQTRYPTSLPATVDAVDPYDFQPGYFYDIPGMTRGHNPDRDNRIRTLAFTLENRTEVLPGVAIVSALRKDFIDLDLTNRRAVTASSPASASRSYSPTTGRLALNLSLIHILIGADASLTGYGGGLHRKRWLLDHEGRWRAAKGAPVARAA